MPRQDSTEAQMADLAKALDGSERPELAKWVRNSGPLPSDEDITTIRQLAVRMGCYDAEDVIGVRVSMPRGSEGLVQTYKTYDMDKLAELMQVPPGVYTNDELIFLKDTVFVNPDDGFFHVSGGNYSPKAVGLLIGYLQRRLRKS